MYLYIICKIKINFIIRDIISSIKENDKILKKKNHTGNSFSRDNQKSPFLWEAECV
jgi:hypothetical protein